MSKKPLALVDPAPRTLDLIFSQEDLVRLESLVDTVVWKEGRMPDEEVEKHLGKATFIIGQTDLPRGRLERAPKLRAVINVEGNFQPNVDYEHCFQRGIHVLGTGVVFGQAVAEMALGMALDLARGISEHDRLFRNGLETYGRPSNAGSFLLAGADLGLIGFGNIGRALLPLLAPFGGRVRVYDPWLPERYLESFGLIPGSLEEVLGSSHVVFVLAGATEENHGMLNAKRLGLMPDGACLVLISRAALADFDGLTEVLGKGSIRAAIDVFPEEPFAADHPLRRLDNVILSAHRAGSLMPVYKLMGEMVADDIGQMLRGLPPVRLQRAERETVARMRSKPVKMS